MKCLQASFFLVSVSILTGCGDSIDRIPIVEEKCGTCHKAENVYRMKRSKTEWDRLVYGMKMRGLKLTETEEKKLMGELYDKLGK